MGTTGPPRTPGGDAFRFRAGRPSLDLCSTLLWRHAGAVEQLREPEDLSRWLVGAGLWTRASAVTEDELAAAHSLREALYRSFLAGLRKAPFPLGDVAVLNGMAGHPGPLPRLTLGGEVHWYTGDPVEAAFSTVARDGIELLTGQHAGRVRECAASDCAFLFVDTSRPGSRRWCAQNRCGNRQHVREHRARRAGEQTAD